MARELIWLENQSFAAWACNECRWIIRNPNPASPGKPCAKAIDAFNLHDCAKFPLAQRPETERSRAATNKAGG
jgi:hypothetical protein